MDFSFKYSLTEEDYAEYNAFSSWKAPWLKQERLKYIVKTFFYISIFFAAGLILIDKIKPNPNHNYPVLLIISVFMISLTTFFEFYQAPHRLKTKARKHIRKEENIHTLNETELFINDLGIINNDKEFNVNLKWDSVKRFAVTKDYFYIYLSSIQALIIPKRLFNTSSSIDDFEKFMNHKIPLSASFRSLGI